MLRPDAVSTVTPSSPRTCSSGAARAQRDVLAAGVRLADERAAVGISGLACQPRRDASQPASSIAATVESL